MSEPEDFMEEHGYYAENPVWWTKERIAKRKSILREVAYEQDAVDRLTKIDISLNLLVKAISTDAERDRWLHDIRDALGDHKSERLTLWAKALRSHVIDIWLRDAHPEVVGGVQ